MRKQESKTYHCSTFEHNFSPSAVGIGGINIRLESHWREKVCSWSYEVIDYFQLSRKTVAISLDLFDRFFAKSGNMYDERRAHLTSLTTLYIAIKIHETKKVPIYALTQLCIGYFLREDIIKMEIEILKSLNWMVNPPTTVDFIYYMLTFLPVNICTPVRGVIFDLSCYVTELSVCDSSFVGIPRSIIAFAAILNVLDHEICPIFCPVGCQEEFLSDLYLCLDLNSGGNEINLVRKRLLDILNHCKNQR